MSNLTQNGVVVGTDGSFDETTMNRSTFGEKMCGQLRDRSIAKEQRRVR